MFWVWFFAFLIVGAITWITIWVTNKAYSKKWEESDHDKIS